MNLAKYGKVFDIGLQNTFVYRWNFLLRSVFGFVPLAGTVFIWRAIFDERQQSVGGYEYGSMIYYFLLTILVDNLVTPTEDEWQIAADIRDGQMNAFLTKPLNYLGYRLTLFLSYRLLYTVITIVPVALIFWWFRALITLPHDLPTWPLAVLSLVMAGFIQFFIAYSMAMLAFWILEISTVVFILYSFEYFLSGHIFPLDIMPAWLQGALHWLPFTYELFFPIAIFLEKMKPHELWSGLAIQTGWLFVTWSIARLMWHRGVRRYQAVGG
ncbi:MAG: viologen exporter family transport system permease protein [Chthoniobacter sp.]|nr:viologen exporter family transport system permease protein [Chthoniobacter sp.]